jgi:hypothetical protein
VTKVPTPTLTPVRAEYRWLSSSSSSGDTPRTPTPIDASTVKPLRSRDDVGI